MLWKSIVSKSLSEKRKKKNSGSDAGFVQWYIGVTIVQKSDNKIGNIHKGRPILG